MKNQSNYITQIELGLKLAYKTMLEKKAAKNEDVIMASSGGLPVSVKATQLLKELISNKK